MISEEEDSLIEENLLTSMACKPSKPAAALAYESDSLFNRNLPNDFQIGPQRAKSYMDQSFRECNLSDLSNSPRDLRRGLETGLITASQNTNQDAFKFGGQESQEDESIMEGTMTQHQILSGYVHPGYDHQQTLASVACASELKEVQLMSTMQKLNLAAAFDSNQDLVRSH